MSLSEKVEQLNREISATVERALSEMRRELSQRLRANHDQIARHVESFTPELPGVFIAHEDLAPAAESLRTAAVQEGRKDLVGSLRESFAALDRARSQAEILGALLEGSGRFAGRAAILLLRDGELRGWDGRGWHEAGPAISALRLKPEGAWEHLGAGQHGYRLSATEAALLCSRLESPLPREAVLLPIVLRDRVAAALYADRVDNAQITETPETPETPEIPEIPENSEIEVEALQLLAYGAAMAIETLAFRERGATATLADLGAAGAATPATLPAPAEPAATAAPAAPAAALHPSEGGTELAGSPSDRQAFLDDSLAYAARHTTELPMPEDRPGEPVAAEDSESTAAIPLDSLDPLKITAPTAAPERAADDGRSETVLLPRPGFREAVPPSWARPLPREEAEEVEAAGEAARPTAPFGRPEPVPPPPPEPPALLEHPGPAAESFATTLTPVAAPAPEPAAGVEPARAEAGNDTHPDLAPAETVAARPPASGFYREPTTAGVEPLRSTPLTSGTPEVRPPSGVSGPGWAFATSRLTTASEESAHEEARRLARLLVSEIKLYNEEQVEAGRRNRDIYERLREDIDRSRQMYEERVEPRLAKSTDYFYQELVRILAAGDSKALGI